MVTLLRGSLAFLGYLVNTLFWGPCIIVLGLIKLLPISVLRRLCTYLIDGIATTWISINNLNQQIFSRTTIIVNELPQLSPKQWYMVISNHQSWVDILLLQRVFNRKIPMLKFFLKQELIYVPVIGLAWWALDFPFMRRYSKGTLAKKPHLKGKDQEATRKSCEKFQIKPVAVMNFVEGTRFTPAKYDRQQSRYPRLLTPKAGGLAMSLDAMGGKIQQLLNVTIYYPDGTPSFWQFLSGQVPRVELHVEHCTLNHLNELNYHQTEQRLIIQTWLNDLWQKKSDYIAQLHHHYHNKN
ncbi:acyltransferase [Ferrimonas lipolytica]|uniref:Acyltransferase n=1 Tax=Ferrimonas lipolytica TaxID=2724191 RepID=A0A6H1UIN5_9GAMM|nr:acyltransferase [Ferrimonas lipolytica]QIZ78076.1 acyltransferase [Ferrimonas lipolytica]